MYIQDVRERSQKMPNWVMNELTCIFQTSEELQSFKSKVDEENFYNSFFPMPEILQGTQCPNVNVDKLILEYNKEGFTAKTLQEIIESNHHWFSIQAEQALKNQQAFEETGYYEWYQWCLDNWGVKWDASALKSKELSDKKTFSGILQNYIPKGFENIAKAPISPQVIASQANILGGSDVGIKTPSMEVLLEKLNKLEEPTPPQ